MPRGCSQRLTSTVAFMSVSLSANIGKTMTSSSDKNAILSLLSLYLGLFRDDLGRKYGMLKMLKQYTGTGYLNYVILFAGLRAR